ncbi:energy transducer TonB [Aurantibacter sp.]|uniref:energy transducer TonB n=1 Tax=Aurantibacter sp. TaxID=2807103 RepID=UPI0035C850DB
MKKALLAIILLFTIGKVFSQESTSPKDIDSLRVINDVKEVPFSVIEDVPIYSGCGSFLSSEEKKQYMSSKINEFIAKNFDISITQKLGLPDGPTKITCAFTIDKTGKAINIRARASHPLLEKEAIRVLKLIPEFEKPGYFKGKPVEVPYGLPIKFVIKNETNTENSPLIYPTHKRCTKITNNKLLEECTIKKVSNFIQLSVDLELADRLFPQDKTTQFRVLFTIDKKGNIKDITAKAHKKEMAKEVIRVLRRLPKFKKPAMKNGEPVDFDFSYLMTIYF